MKNRQISVISKIDMPSGNPLVCGMCNVNLPIPPSHSTNPPPRAMKTPSRFQAFLQSSALVAVALGLAAQAGAQVTSYIATNTAWKILDNGTTPAANWKAAGFADGAWRSANSSFGYKVGGAVNNGATSLIHFNTGDDANNPKWITTYFRKSFNPGAILPVALLSGARWDDGIIVYINGVELRRENMPAGAVDGNTLATGAIDVQAGLVSSTFIVPNGTMVANTNNVIAVELHQAATTSSDVFFDFTLGGTTSIPCYGDATVGVFQDFEEGVEPFLTADHFGYLRAFNHTLLQFETWVVKNDNALGYTPPLALLSSFPGDTRQMAFSTNSKFILETERIDTQNFKNIKASLQMRSELGSGASWAAADNFKATLFTSSDGITFTQTPWFNYTFVATPTVPTTLVDENAPNHWMIPTIGQRIVVSATNANPIVIVSNFPHGYLTGDSVTIAGAAGNTAVNGTRVITKISDTSFSLNGIAGNGAHTANTGIFVHKTLNADTTTNPPTWSNLVPAGWSAFNTPPAPGVLTTNFWRAGNQAAASPKGGIGYDNTAGTADFNAYLDSISKVPAKAEMFGTASFAGETRMNLRIPFSTSGVNFNNVTKVELQIRYDDSFGAWLNGVKLVGSSSPVEPTTDTANPTDRGAGEPGATFTTFDVTAIFKANVNSGPNNVLAVRGYNSTATNNDFILQPRIVIFTPGPPDPNSTAALDTGGGLTFRDSAVLIPNGTRSVKIKFEGTTSGSASKYFLMDNLKVTGDAIAAVDLGSAIALQLPTASYPEALRSATADADGDGMKNLLEYAVGSNMAVSAQSTVLPNSTVQPYAPVISPNPDGTIQLRFRTLVGAFDPNDLQNGAFDIKDIRYQPERADTGNGDWQSFSQFVVSAPTVSNDDGTQLVTISTITPISGLGVRQMFRIQVSNNRDPWLAPGVTPDTPICDFPESIAW